MSEQICSHCHLPIHPSDGGLRHFGFYTAHQESRCLELLRMRITGLEADAERYRWLRDRAGNAVMKKLEAESVPSKWDDIVDEWRVTERPESTDDCDASARAINLT